MASVFKRKNKHGVEVEKWTCCYKGEDGKQKKVVGYADKRLSLKKATDLETRSAQIRDGSIRQADVTRDAAKLRKTHEHIADYRLGLIAKGSSLLHCDRIAAVLTRLMESASAPTLDKITSVKVQDAAHRMKAAGKSVRTCNHAIGAARAFGRWLAINDRVEHDPMRQVSPLPSGSGRVYERRALSADQQSKLLAVAQAGQPIKISRRGCQYAERWITGPERATLYRIALETGFRAGEIRTLTAESFHCDADPPFVHLEKGKNGKPVDQQVRPEFAAFMRAWLKSCGERPPLVIPDKTAKLLRHDLKAAGIPHRDAKGLVVDFHSLRATYVTNLIRGGASVKTTQTLARHSTPVLTIGLYTKTDDDDKSKALGAMPSDLRRADPADGNDMGKAEDAH